MRVFLTGATGAIGRYAIPEMLKAGHAVTGVARSDAGRSTLARLGVTAVELDLFDAGAVRRAVAGHDAVVNLATHVPRGAVRPFLPKAWAATDRLRREASRILAEAGRAAGATRFVQESFALTYPDSKDRWISEDVPLQPARYNRSVLDAEESAEHFTRHGGDGIALRFALLYGPGDDFTKQLRDSVRRGWFPVFGRPDAYLSMVHHADAGSAVAASLAVPAGAYNIVDSQPLTRREFAATVAHLIGVRTPKLAPLWLARLGGSLGETLARSLRISNAKLRATDTWAPRFATASAGWTAALLPVERARPMAEHA